MCSWQGARPELLPERLLGSVRFSRLDLKTAIPLNPNDYPDDLLNPSPPASPHLHLGSANGSIDNVNSGLQNAHSWRSGSGSGSNNGLESGHLESLRYAHVCTNEVPYAFAPHTFTNCLCHFAAGLGCTHVQDFSTDSLPAPHSPPPFPYPLLFCGCR